MSNISSRVLTGKKIKNTYQNLLQIYDNNITDGLGNTVFDTSSCLITSSWAESCSFAGSSSFSVHALSADTASFSLISFVTQSISASWASSSLSASWAPTGTVVSASWASSSLSASYSLFSRTSSYVSSASFSTFSNSSSYSSNSHTSDSSSYVLTVNTSSYSSFAKSASWAPNSVGGTTLNTGSTYEITSSWATTASYALNTNTILAAATTQSSFDMPIEDMSFENSAGLAQVQTTTFTKDINASSLMPYCYVKFQSKDFGAVHDLGYSMYQMKVPKTFGSGLTHSFQYINVGDDGSTGIGTITNTAYWQIQLYAITSSVIPAANMNAAVLVETKVLTQSLSGGSADMAQSVWSTSSYFNDPNGYITTQSVIIINIVRVSTLETSTLGGDGTDYTASLGLISSRYEWGA